VRPNHIALEKLGIGGTNVYRADDPVFQLFRPPWDYNDRCSSTPMTVRQAAEAGREEARSWLETGEEPAVKAFVPMPPFQPPPGFQRAVGAAPLSIQLSMQPMAAFATTAKKPDEETESSLLYGEPEVGGIASATMDTAKEPRTTKVGRGTKKVRLRSKGRTRSLFKSLRLKKRWKSSVSLATDTPLPKDRNRKQLIAEILVLLFGSSASAMARRLFSSSRGIDSLHGFGPAAMIYRILCNGYERLLGALSADVDGFDHLKTRGIRNKRARFYFTEKGWRLFGRQVAANARKAGRVLRRKNPDPAQLVYEDEFQVALLTRKSVPGKRPK
jgi:hypothetical protein